MAALLYVRPLAPARWQWWRAGVAAGAPAEGDLAALRQAAAGTALVLLAPGEEVLLTEARVSARRRAELERAVPFALEDQLLEDIETLQFGIGPVGAEGRVAVALMQRARAEALVAPLRQAGLRLRALLPEPLALALQAERWTALLEGRRVLVRTGADGGFCLEGEAAVKALAARAARERTPPGLRLLRLGEAEPALERALVQAAGGTSTVDRADSLAAVFLPDPAAVLAFDLLPPAGAGATSARLWAVAAALVLCALGLHAALLGYRVHRAEAELAALRTEHEAVFRAAFPEVGRLVDLGVQAGREVADLRARLGASEPVLELLLGAGRAKAAVPEVELLGVAFEQGVLRLELGAPEQGAIERYREELAGVGVEVASLEPLPPPETGGVAARLELRGQGR